MAQQQLLGNLWCGEVLEKLSDYVDGDLTDFECQELGDHLAACTRCADFGAEFQSMLGALREALTEPSTPSEELRVRVLNTIAADSSGEELS